jgi:hypothetical protein
MTATVYANHPAADVFPMMSESELKALASDVKANGLRDPISLYEGKILDGRNRIAACLMAGVDAQFVPVETDSPCAYVVSKNLHRRQLTVGQKGMVAAKLMPMLEVEAKERHKANGGDRRSASAKSAVVNLPPPIAGDDDGGPRGKSSEIAGKLVGVSGSVVQRSARVLKTNPDLAAKVERGEVTISAAYFGKDPKSASGAKPEQYGGINHAEEKLANFGDKRRQIIENAAKRRIMDGVAQIGGLCHGLQGVSPEILKGTCTEQEIKTWARTLRDLARQLRGFANELSRIDKHDEKAEDADSQTAS